MTILRGFPKSCRGNESFAGCRIEKSDAVWFQTTVGRDDGEGTTAMLVKVRCDFLSKLCGSLIGTFDGDGGDFLFEQLSDVVSEIDDLVELTGGGNDVGSNGKGSDEMKGAIITDLTIGGKLGKSGLGGHGNPP